MYLDIAPKYRDITVMSYCPALVDVLTCQCTANFDRISRQSERENANKCLEFVHQDKQHRSNDTMV